MIKVLKRRKLRFDDPTCLDEKDMERVHDEAFHRMLSDLADGVPDRKVAPSGIGINILGAATEYSVVKQYDAEWTGCYPTRKEFLVNKRLIARGDPAARMDTSVGEVRGTYTFRTGGLIIHKKDRDDWPFILVQQENNTTYHIIGWLYGAEAKQKDFWDTQKLKRAAYLVPPEYTRPMHTLIGSESFNSSTSHPNLGAYT